MCRANGSQGKSTSTTATTLVSGPVELVSPSHQLRPSGTTPRVSLHPQLSLHQLPLPQLQGGPLATATLEGYGAQLLRTYSYLLDESDCVWIAGTFSE